MKRITVKEEFRLPGTDIILEKGDQIKLKEKAQFTAELYAMAQNLMSYTGDPVDIALDAGEELVNEIWEMAAIRMPSPIYKAFMKGVKRGVKTL